MGNFSEQINKLPSLTNYDEINRSYVLASNMQDDARLSSNALNIPELAEKTINEIKYLSSFNPKGKWNFKKGITLPSKTFSEAIRNGLSSTLIPRSFMENDFFKLLNVLSSDLYVRNHIPSAKGEVIFSTTLKTEAAVRNIYGSYTSWRQIPGRFILATTGASSAHASSNAAMQNALKRPGVKAGEATHSPTIQEMPPHKHVFVCENNSKEISIEKTVDVTSDSAKFSGVLIGEHAKEVGATTPKLSHCGVDPDHKYGIKVSYEQSKYGRIYGNGGGNAEIKENTAKNKAHSNMPPFYTVYIWERVN